MRLKDTPCVRIRQALEVSEIGSVKQMSAELMYGGVVMARCQL